MIFLFLCVLGLFVWCLTLHRQLAELRDRLERSQLRPEPPPRVAQPEPVPPPPPIRETPPEAEPAAQPVPAFTAAPSAEPGPQGASLGDRVRGLLGNQEWELLVGGSLLNKLGAVVLVIGIALFMGYSFGHITPAGRAAMATITSAALLGAGIWVEKRGQYRIFARGLIGAGWAALYATAYAIYALPQARIIQDPFTGSILMLMAAVGMIWHSLRYRAQAVTAVAYFAAFAAMAATPSSPFAVISLIPLAASLLYLAARFEWHSTALFGLAATYLTCISRGSSGAPLTSTQTLFLAYWLLFEAFDLQRVARRYLAGGIDLLFPLNTLCFIGLSYLAWSQQRPDLLWAAAAFGATLFLADSLLRATVRPPATFAEGTRFNARLRAGSFEGAFLVAAVLAGFAIAGRVPGVWSSCGLALEAEIVYLAGLRFESSFLRRLGARAFAVSLLRLLSSAESQGKTALLGHSAWNWTPPALWHAALFYLNRILRRPNVLMSSCAAAIVLAVLGAEAPVPFVGAAWILFALILFEVGLRKRAVEFRMQAALILAAGVVNTALPRWGELQWSIPALAVGFTAIYAEALRTRWMHEVAANERHWFALGSSAASAGLALLLAWRIVPPEFLGLAWCAVAVAALEAGSRRLPAELRLWFGPLALAAGAAVGLAPGNFGKFPAMPVWMTYAGACLMGITATARLAFHLPDEATEWERTSLRDAVAALTAAAALALTWLVVPDPFVTVAWTLIAVAMLETGNRAGLPSFRNIALTAWIAVYLRVFAFDLEHAPLRAIPFAIAGLYWAWYRNWTWYPNKDSRIARLLFWAALLPLVFLIGKETGVHAAPLVWVTLAILLLVAGNRANLPDARWQSYCLATLAFLYAIQLDIAPPRLWISILTAAGFYVAQYFAKAAPEKQAPLCFSLLGTLLLGALLYGEVSGGLLTVSWGLEGLALLGAGFALRERVLRLEGLALLLVCILKLFLYDLRNLETIYRILSFIALGLILLCVSWIYTRFREQVRRFL